MVRVRFAPSPTGFLHVGGARTALFNYLYACNNACNNVCNNDGNNDGTFILRIDDTDLERSEARFEEDIIASMKWLGLEWNEGVGKGGEYGPYRQSEKLARYTEVAETLRKSGHAKLDEEGVLRLCFDEAKIVFEDEICGTCQFAPESLGTPPALLRSDGSPTYHLASVVDDIDMRITHIIRGQDHLTNTAKHVMIFQALGVNVPTFAHLPLILGQDGGKLSKRNSEGMVSVSDFRREGYLPQALNNFLVLLGWSHPEGKELLSLSECIESFQLSRVGNTGSIFDTNKLEYLNGYWIRTLPIDEFVAHVDPFLGEWREIVNGKPIAYWTGALEAFRTGFKTLKCVGPLCHLLFSDVIEVAPECFEFIDNNGGRDKFMLLMNKITELIFSPDFDGGRDCLSEEEFNQIFAALKKDYKKEAAYLFKSFRIGITGSLSGYEVKVLVPFIEKSHLRSRLNNVCKLL